MKKRVLRNRGDERRFSNPEEVLRLILALSTNFIALPPEDMDEGIDDVLKAIGSISGADRGYIFQFNDNRVVNTHRWYADGIDPAFSNFGALSIMELPWFYKKVRNLETINITDVNNLPVDAFAETKRFLRDDVKSFALIPMVSGYSPIGLLGFDTIKERMDWPEEVLSLFRIATEIFVNALKRKEIEEALKRSEEKYRRIFENAIIGIFQVTTDNRFISVNKAFARMHGYESPEEMINDMPYMDNRYANPEDLRFIKESLKTAGYVNRFELELFKKAGAKFWGSINIQVVKDMSGSALYIEGTLEDITERKRIEDLLHQQRERFLTILQNAPYGMVFIDEDGRYVYINPEFTKITGYTMEDVPTGSEWLNKAFPDEEYRRIVVNTWMEDKRSGWVDRTFTIRCKDGGSKEVGFKIAPLSDGRTVVMLSDITALQQAEVLFRTLADSSPAGVCIIQEGRFCFVNPYFLRITGYPMAEVIGEEAERFIFPADKEIGRQKAKRQLEGKDQSAYEIRIVRKDGEVRWILQTLTSITYNGRTAMLGNFIDITEKKEIEARIVESEERYRILTEQSLIGVYLLQDNLFRYVNPAFARMHGYKKAEMVGRLGPLDLIIPEDHKKIFEKRPKRVGEAEGDMPYELRIKRKDGVIRVVEIYSALTTFNGRPAVLGTVLDITEKKEIEERLQTMSVIDELTGLYNRRGFFVLAEEQMNIARGFKRKMFFFYIDIDNMKWINDNLGHRFGDEALIATARILKETFRETDVIGRIGGDEFALLAVGMGDKAAEVLRKRLQMNIDAYNMEEQRPYRLSLSIGGVGYEGNNPIDFEEMITKADELMYEEKRKRYYANSIA